MAVLDLHAELAAIVDALDARGTGFALCGALALAVHGHPRATKDIDLLVSEDELADTKQVLRGLGYTLAAAPMTFRSGVTVHRVSRAEGDELCTVDLVLASPPLADAYAGRTRLAWGARSVPVVTRSALVAMKRLAARPQDLADLDALGEGP